MVDARRSSRRTSRRTATAGHLAFGVDGCLYGRRRRQRRRRPLERAALRPAPIRSQGSENTALCTDVCLGHERVPGPHDRDTTASRTTPARCCAWPSRAPRTAQPAPDAAVRGAAVRVRRRAPQSRRPRRPPADGPALRRRPQRLAAGRDRPRRRRAAIRAGRASRAPTSPPADRPRAWSGTRRTKCTRTTRRGAARSWRTPGNPPGDRPRRLPRASPIRRSSTATCSTCCATARASIASTSTPPCFMPAGTELDAARLPRFDRATATSAPSTTSTTTRTSTTSASAVLVAITQAPSPTGADVLYVAGKQGNDFTDDSVVYRIEFATSFTPYAGPAGRVPDSLLRRDRESVRAPATLPPAGRPVSRVSPTARRATTATRATAPRPVRAASASTRRSPPTARAAPAPTGVTRAARARVGRAPAGRR